MDANEAKKYVDSLFNDMISRGNLYSIFEDMVNKNPNKAVFTNKDKVAIYKAIQVMVGHSDFVAKAVENDKITQSDMEAYLNMIRHHFDNMATLFNMEQHLSEKLDESYELLRKANTKIRKLETENKPLLSADAIKAGLEYYEALFQTWYKLIGFRYANIELLSYGILAEFSFEINNKQDAISNVNMDAELKQKIANSIQYEFDSYDLHDEGYHKEILDTDKNRINIMNLFNKTFPGTEIKKFESWADIDKKLLRFEVIISFNQLEEWVKNLPEIKE